MRIGNSQDLSTVRQLRTSALKSEEGRGGENGQQGETSSLNLHKSIVSYSSLRVNAATRLVSDFSGWFSRFMRDNRNTMKGIQGLLVMLTFVGVGCGGDGGAATSFRAGTYEGTVTEPGRAYAGVQIIVQPNGTVTGTCTINSATSAAIMGRATLTGTANMQTGKFDVSGFYVSNMPGPPGGGGGAIHVTGTIPSEGTTANQMTVDDNGYIFSGSIGPAL